MISRAHELFSGIVNLAFACFFLCIPLFLGFTYSLWGIPPALVLGIYGGRSIYKALHGRKNDTQTVLDIEKRIESLNDSAVDENR